MSTLDLYGRPTYSADVTDMAFPVRCRWCRHVHDAAKVKVVGRYSDCSTWRCPKCKVLIDDRPAAWGGSAYPMNRGGSDV